MKEIGPEQTFYGYPVGVHLEEDENGSGMLYATFEYDDERTSYVVPDLGLFRILASAVQTNAYFIKEGKGMQLKLWIAKKHGKWLTEEPSDRES